MIELTPALASALDRTTLEEVERKGGHDAIVVGGGGAGGLAAALLTERGLNVLVLDAGIHVPAWRAPFRRSVSNVLRGIDVSKAMRVLPYRVLMQGERAAKLLGRVRQPIQSTCYAWPSGPELFVDDRAFPYETGPSAPFCWIRSHGLGGRLIVPTHGRQYLRHCARDFAPVDDLSPAWPFAPETLDPWYDLVERRLGLSGRHEHSPWVPDSVITHHRDPAMAETLFMDSLKNRFSHYKSILGRFAPPMPSLAAAAETGRLLCRQGAIVRHLETTPDGRISGVCFYDYRDQSLKVAHSRLVFLCASTLESTRILLSSQADRHPMGLGAKSGALGRNLMDHVSIRIDGTGPDLGPPSEAPISGSNVYMPRFDSRQTGEPGKERGFGVRAYQMPGRGSSYFIAVSDAEMLPNPDNKVELSSRKDAFGLPVLRITCKHGPLEEEVSRRQKEGLTELVEATGVRLHKPIEPPSVPGSAIHECGSARMGSDPGQSVVDPNNECWEARGLYMTDGACFPSEGLVNPTLTILALTARACNHALA